ncbi:MAG: hypothetical protein KF729_07995 [Sandaracinaceae bacterium]|nr:hypothetical protein [Sandaracinaceae bacterium]
MRPRWALALALLALAACTERGAAAQERVRVRATHADGVPLHPEERASAVSGRLPDGAEVVVLAWGAERRWLEVRASDGARGWISARYVAREAPTDAAPWASREACLAAPPPARAAGTARIASWNLRWFPDGSSQGPSDRPTDVEWMACAIGSLGADAVGVQEVLLHERGAAAVEQLTRHLSARTGGRWRGAFDECPRDGRQHVGWLWDETRVTLTAPEQLDDVNPLGGCAGRLRPGLAATLRYGGREVRALVVHLDSGTHARDRANRDRSVARIVAHARRWPRGLVLGDFNPMGGGPSGGEEERASLDAQLAAIRWRRPAGEVGCTEIHRGRGVALDHAFVAPALGAARVEVAGVCARTCQLARGEAPPALGALSDHCPLVVELPLR